ncbi:MAG: Membrane protein [uncultured bacterium]|nr:MAG: Membrane protein [uncultured bacterium]
MKRSSDERTKGIIALVLLTLVFASMGLFVRYLNAGFLLFQQVYLRVFAAFILGIVIFNKDLSLEKLKKISVKEWGLFLFRGISGYLFGVTLFSQAILLTKYSSVSFIGALPFTAVFGVFLFKEKLNIQKFLLILLAFIGVVLISVKDYSNIFIWGRGEVVALVSTIFYSLSLISRKWHSKLLNNKEITTITFFIAGIAVLITSICAGEGLPLNHWTLGLFTAVIGAGLFNVINLFLINYGFQKVEGILASNILTLESFFAIILGFLFYKELPGLKEIIGGVLIVGSVLLMNQLDSKRRLV